MAVWASAAGEVYAASLMYKVSGTRFLECEVYPRGPTVAVYLGNHTHERARVMPHGTDANLPTQSSWKLLRRFTLGSFKVDYWA